MREEGHTNSGNHCSTRPHEPLPRGPARQQAKRYTTQMQETRRHHETYRVRNRIGRARKFGPVCVAMKDRERSDDNGGEPDWWATSRSYQQSQYDSRKRNTLWVTSLW